MRWFRCLKLGHIASRCNNVETCARGKERYDKEIPCNRPSICANCGDEHNALTSKCPTFEKEIQCLKIVKKLPFWEARDPVYRKFYLTTWPSHKQWVRIQSGSPLQVSLLLSRGIGHVLPHPPPTNRYEAGNLPPLDIPRRLTLPNSSPLMLLSQRKQYPPNHRVVRSRTREEISVLSGSESTTSTISGMDRERGRRKRPQSLGLRERESRTRPYHKKEEGLAEREAPW